MMAANGSEAESAARTAAQFATTHWSLVLAAGDSASPDSTAALEELCRAYWFPLYAWARRVGHSSEEAEDLVQGFFAYLLEKHWVGKARPEIGRFRSFLLAIPQGIGAFRIQSWINQSFDVQASTDLATWSKVNTVTNTSGTLVFEDAEVAQHESRYYRVMVR